MATQGVGWFPMKARLIVVQGKPEGKIILLTGPVFRIGRGETCHLRPNSERVSREHAEFIVTADAVTLRDLGSRNGTLVNGRALTQPLKLKDRDQVQVGPLTFAVSIQDAVADELERGKPGSSPAKTSALDPSGPIAEEIPALPTNLGSFQGSETLLIPAFTESPASPPPSVILPCDDDEGYERQTVVEGETVPELAVFEGPHAADAAGGLHPQTAKKPRPDPSARSGDKGTSAAGAEILRQLMERQRIAK
jgi:pSer/pThr/pTyr-binding forkhead associated (FHA) protein